MVFDFPGAAKYEPFFAAVVPEPPQPARVVNLISGVT
jgi:hypothetical protein